MKHRVYYDPGRGYAALLAAAMRLELLPSDVLPTPVHLQNFLQDHARLEPPGQVNLLGERGEERVYWCGLGRAEIVCIRTWRHFLHLYGERQADYFFYRVPLPKPFRWRRGERLLAVPGKRERGRELLARAAVREYARFQNVLMTDWQEG
ncbi:DUF3189 family protein [Tumebacillus flagellatus]|uniref:Uncharacterized protein n=1 Tax=Tumebacillus flagellatus TaxID=1157490 RepID=A0A074LRG9_9BACL|nr:DUF3189 family protein [Tumebacillus flagellatus]KEO83679.1 hypothetical protein EL26_08475 [Tumebacillus flagellatus]